MAEFDNIISSESSEQTIDKAPQVEIDPPVKAPKGASTHGNLPTGVGMTGKEDTGFHRDTNIHEGIDVEKFKTDENRGSVVMGTGGLDALINERAEAQGFGQQLLNMAGQAIGGEIVGGTIEGFGYLGEIPKALDYMSGTEHEFGNFLTDLGQDIREGSQDMMPIYQRTDSDWHDSGWWASNGVSVASSLSMMLPSMAATKALGMLGKGVSKGMGMLHNSLDIASKMGKYGTWAAEGITQAVVSRHMENAMEASGVFREQKEKLMDSFNPATGKLFTEQEANEAAGQGASSTYNANWAMLGQDVLQYLALGKVFNPKTMSMETAGAFTKSLAKEGIGKKALGVAETFLSEGGEEAYQYYMSEKGKLLSDKAAGLITQEEYSKKLGEKVGDKGMREAAFWGGLGGNVFQGVGGATNELFKSKERRNFEDKYAQAQGDFIKERGVAFANMQKEVMKADQTGDPVKRQTALNEMSMAQALDALSNDSIDQHLEMLTNLKNMSPEETKAFAAQTGTDINIDLLKESIPQAIKQAQELRTSYMKNLNKYDETTSAVLTRNDYHMDQFSKRDKVLAGEMQETKAKIHDIGSLSGHYTEMMNAKADITALKKVNQIHAAAIEQGTYAEDQKNREELIALNNAKIEKAAQKITHLKANDQRDAEQKAEDNRVAAGYANVKDTLDSARTERGLISDTIYLRQKENAYVKTEAFQTEKKFREEKAKVKAVSNQAGIEKARKDIAENMQYSPKKKEELNKDLDVRSKELADYEKAKAAQEARANHNTTLETEKRTEANSATSTAPVIAKVPITDNIEDEFADEEADIENKYVTMELAKKDIFGETSENAKIYSGAGSKAHQEWVTNGKDKRRKKDGSGDNIAITPHKEVYAGHQEPEKAQDAINLFNDAIKGEELSAQQLAVIYNYLPLKVTVNNDPTNFAFLSSRLKSTEGGRAWQRQDLPTRASYINHMIHNKTESYNADVVAQYGGELERDDATGGVIPENNIGDFQHVKLAATEKYNNKKPGNDFSQLKEKEQLDLIVAEISPALMYSNEYGVLNQVTTKETHPEFRGTQITLPNVAGTNGTVMPMAGSVFLAMKKSDGFNFPLKLNLAKSSQEEAKLIVDLCDELLKNGNPNVKFNDLPQEIQDDINTNFRPDGSALAAIFGESVNPNIMELIGAFVYMDASTKGKTSEFRFTSENKVNIISFGIDGTKFTAGSAREDIMQFLTNTKRKQFDIKRWKNSASYRRYAIKSGLLNTDAKVDKKQFTKGNTDIYISSPAQKSVIQTVKEAAVTSPAKLAVKDRRVFSDNSKASNTTNGKVSVPYVDAKGQMSNITRDTEQAARQAVKEAYDNQESKTAAKTQTVVAKQTAEQLVNADRLDSEESKDRLKTINAMQSKEASAYFEFLSNAYYLAGNKKTDEQIAEIVNQKMEAKYSTESVGNSFGRYANQINSISKAMLNEISTTLPHYDKIDAKIGEQVRGLFKGFEKDMLKQMSLIETMKDTRTAEQRGVTKQAPMPAQAREVVAKLEQVKKDIVLDPTGEFYINSKTGKKYKRVTNVISTDDMSGANQDLLNSASTIGNKVDKLLRDFFSGNLGTFESYDLIDDRKQYDEFIKGLEEVKSGLDARGETILSNDIMLHNDELGIAGTVDLLSVDKDGNFRIYDVKTMRGNNFTEQYKTAPGVSKFDAQFVDKKTGKLKDSKRTKYNKQLAMYRILLNNTYGIKAKQLAVLPIVVQYPDVATKTKHLSILKGVKMDLLNEVEGAKLLVPKVQPKPVVVQTPAQKVANEPKPVTQMSVAEKKAVDLNAMLNYNQNKAAEETTEVETKNKGVITIGKDKVTVSDNGTVMYADGKPVNIASAMGKRLINKARLKSGYWKHKSVPITTNDGKPKGTYAVIVDDKGATKIINITPGSASNGNEITQTSPDGIKVMEGYNAKSAEVAKPVTTTTKPQMTQAELNKLMGLPEDFEEEGEVVEEVKGTKALEKKITDIKSTDQAGHAEANNAFNQEMAAGNTEIPVSLANAKALEMDDSDFEDIETTIIEEVNSNKTVDRNYKAVAKSQEKRVVNVDDNPFSMGGGADFDMSMLLNLNQDDITDEDLNCTKK